MPSVLITGAGRGIGLELARQYTADGWEVHGTLRDLGRGDALRALGSSVTVHQLEVTDKESTEALRRSLGGIALDVVIANAGVTGPRGMTIDNVDRDSWLETLAVNTIAPLALVSATKRNLDKGRQKRVIAISSRLGSIASNTNGGLFAYRSSKAALNATWRSLSVGLREEGYICVVLSPGWVRTEMGGAGADLDVEESVRGMRGVIAGLTPQQTGLFYDYKGEELPW